MKTIALIAAVLAIVARVHVTLPVSGVPVTVPVVVLAEAAVAAVIGAVVWGLARKVRGRHFWLAVRYAQ